MKLPTKILIATAAALALTRSSKKEEEEAEETQVDEVPLAMTGFQSTIDDVYEQKILERQPVDLGPYEDTEPTCGQFYQSQRGDTWLGEHARSITYRALHRTTFMHAKMRGFDEPEKRARRAASNAGMRKALFELCVSQQWADEVYCTFLVSTRDPLGPHGRGIPLSRCCAENRVRIQEGEAVVRIVPRGRPENRGLGVPNRKAKHGTAIGSIRLARPYLWLPVVNPDELLAGRVTTRGMRWEDGSTGLEPPPCVVNLRMAVLGE